MSLQLAWSDGGNLKRLTFDATPGDTHLWTATVTEHPVEKGVAITDHVRPGAFRLSIDVCISNTPLSLPGSDADSFTEGVVSSTQQLALGTGLGFASTQQWSAQFDRVRKVYDALTSLFGNPPTDGITVMTSLALYDSMQVVNLSAPRNAQIGSKALRFTVDMQQIRTVESQTVATPAPRVAQRHKGHKPTKEETNKPKASALHNIVGSL